MHQVLRYLVRCVIYSVCYIIKQTFRFQHFLRWLEATVVAMRVEKVCISTPIILLPFSHFLEDVNKLVEELSFFMPGAFNIS